MHMSEMRMTEVLVPIAASTDRLVQTVKALNDTEVSGKTLVPPWTRGHVITHVARAADSLCRLLTWARTGVETPQYSQSLDARAAEIEAGARRPVHELVADVVASAERFDDAIRSLPGGAWSHEVRMRTGELRTPEALASARLRELEVHHVDLAAKLPVRRGAAADRSLDHRRPRRRTAAGAKACRLCASKRRTPT